MPIKIGKNSFDKFRKAAEYIKRTKPGIKNPSAYVAAIEKKQAKAR